MGGASRSSLPFDAPAVAIRPEQLELIVARSMSQHGSPLVRRWFGVTLESLIGGAIVGATVGVVVGAAVVRFLN
jgi:hypothetical protein